MKNKMKKLAVMMFMVVLLCGSALTAQAQCNHTGERRNPRIEISISYHEHDGISAKFNVIMMYMTHIVLNVAYL